MPGLRIIYTNTLIMTYITNTQQGETNENDENIFL